MNGSRRKLTVLSLFLPVLVVLGVGCERQGETSYPEVTSESATTRLAAPDQRSLIDAVFEGVLPCASCPGVSTRIWLKRDRTFRRQRVFLDSGEDPAPPIFDLGRWQPTIGGRLVLTSSDGSVTRFTTEPAAIALLDQQGNPIASEHNHRLAHIDERFGAFGESMIDGMYTYFADAAIFQPCHTWTTIPVVMIERHIDLERAYLEHRSEPAAPLLVRIHARIEDQPAMEGDDLEESVVVTGVDQTFPGESCIRDVSLANGAGWRLVELDGMPVPEKSGMTPSLTFEEDTVTGFTGCNRLMGSVMVDGDSLRLGPLASTRRACPDPVESRFLALLDAVDNYRILGGELLMSSGRELVALFHAIRPTGSRHPG